MGPLPLAFSVHHFISSVGADAGFAAILGIAVLVLLHFAQARETSALRERAIASEQHAAQLEGRLTALARSQTAQAQAPQPQGPQAQAPRVAPVAAASGARPAGLVAAPGVAPVPPAGVGAPALSAATRLIPAREDEVPQPVGSASALAAPAPAIGVPPAPRPVTAAGGANGTAKPPYAAALPTGRSPLSPPRGGRPGRTRRLRARPVLTVLLAAGGVVAVAVVLLVLTTGGGVKQAASRSTATTNARSRSSTVNPASVTVAVLNGTATQGLARTVATKLGGAGYKQGTVSTATDQTRTATVVAYLPGYKRDALAVASSLKLSSASVAPVDPSTQGVACPSTTACPANVVVTVGADLASTP